MPNVHHAQSEKPVFTDDNEVTKALTSKQF